MWIRSYRNLRDSLKTNRLTRRLGIGKAQAIGHMHLLWWWALEHAPNGDLSGLYIDEITEAAEWTDEPEAFLDALEYSGFLNDRKLAEWSQIAPIRRRSRTPSNRPAMRREWDAIAAKVRPLVLERDGHTCQLCGGDTSLEIDHVVPIARGGTNELDNLQVLCRRCNRRKGAR